MSIIPENVGEYLVTHLVAGRYTVSCEMKGFRKEIFTDLTVRVGTSSRVDFSLQPPQEFLRPVAPPAQTEVEHRLSTWLAVLP